MYGTNKIIWYVNKIIAYKFSHTMNPFKRVTTTLMNPSTHAYVIGVDQNVFIVGSFLRTVGKLL